MCVFRSLFFALALLASGGALGHSTTLAKVHIGVEESGDVRFELILSEEDVLELFDVDLSSPREGARLLEARAGEVLPRYLRLSADGVRCPLRLTEASAFAPRTARLRAEAACPKAPKELTVDWGLSHITSLDVVGVFAIEAPGGIRHEGVLARRAPRATFVVARPSALSTFGRFFLLGGEHILLGWDHLAFLLALLLGCASIRRLLIIVSGFTVAHSVTLALGALDIVRVPPAVVEPIIAASIAVAAVLAFLAMQRGTLSYPGSSSRQTSGPWRELVLVTGFGLVHGLGFASLLREALLEEGSVALPLFAFNLGVEAGQVLAVAGAFPLLALIGRQGFARVVFLSLLVGLVALGAYVTVARLV